MYDKGAIRKSNVFPLRGRMISLREIEPSDVSPVYLQWMNDPEVSRYLESRFVTHTLDTLMEFVDRIIKSETEWLFAICDNRKANHLGNIKLGPVNLRHGVAEVGLLVGEKKCHCKGIGTEAIRLISAFAFKVLGIRKLTAGMYEANIGSCRAFEKCGFRLEGVLRGQYLVDGVAHDGFRMGLLREDWRA
jgi:RimJ/RimL family protein N-acetyltransferase